MSRLRTYLVAITFVVAAIILVTGLAAGLIVRRGVSARDRPTGLEVTVARAMRRLAVPKAARSLRNPIAPSDEVLREGREHFADHCAICHANNGSGQTAIGQHLFPRAPDMRLPRTQRLTDGELYSIIRNGVRLTGMPAWGDEHGGNDSDSWKLVHFIRHLPAISDVEIQEMEKLNPRSPAENEELLREQQFLRGGHPTNQPPQTRSASPHNGDNQ